MRSLARYGQLPGDGCVARRIILRAVEKLQFTVAVKNIQRATIRYPPSLRASRVSLTENILIKRDLASNSA